MNGDGFFRSTWGLALIFFLAFLVGIGILWYALSVLRGFGEQIQQPIL